MALRKVAVGKAHGGKAILVFKHSWMTGAQK